jgi:hypothetical protein
MYSLSAIGYLPAIFEDQYTVTIHQGEFSRQIITTRSFLPGNETHVGPALSLLGIPISHINSAIERAESVPQYLGIAVHWSLEVPSDTGDPLQTYMECYSNKTLFPIREYTYMALRDWLTDPLRTPRKNWN